MEGTLFFIVGCFYINLNLLIIFIYIFISFQIKLRIKQIAQGNTRRLQSRHDRLWAGEWVSLHRRLRVLNEVGSLDNNNKSISVQFHGISVRRLFTDEELQQLRFRATESGLSSPGHSR